MNTIKNLNHERYLLEYNQILQSSKSNLVKEAEIRKLKLKFGVV